MSFFEWKSLKTKQSHNLLVTKKTEISEQPNPPSERTFAFRVWKAGLFWNIKAKSFSIFFLAEVLFEKTQEPVLFSNIVYIHNLFDDSQPCPCCEFIPWFFLVRPGPSSVSPTGLPAVAWGCRLQPLHCHHHISSSLLLVATGPQLLAPCEGEGWPVMTGDDGRDGRLIVAFFFWGGWYDGGGWWFLGKKFYGWLFEDSWALFYLFYFLFFRLAKRNHSFSKAFFWADFWCVFIFWRQTGRHDILEVSINLRWQNLPKTYHNSTSTKKISNTTQKPEVFSHFFFLVSLNQLANKPFQKTIFFFGGQFCLQAGAEVPCYGSIVATLAEAQQWSNALEVLTEMVQQDPVSQKKLQQQNHPVKTHCPKNTCLLSQCFFFFFSEKNGYNGGRVINGFVCRPWQVVNWWKAIFPTSPCIDVPKYTECDQVSILGLFCSASF